MSERIHSPLADRIQRRLTVLPLICFNSLVYRLTFWKAEHQIRMLSRGRNRLHLLVHLSNKYTVFQVRKKIHMELVFGAGGVETDTPQHVLRRTYRKNWEATVSVD